MSVDIDAPRRAVWRVVSDIASQVQWMDDALAIHFTSSRRTGVGTTFDCDTCVGPFRFTDHMEVVEWRAGHALAIAHTGLVSGRGRFVLRRRRRGRTRFVWDERIRFPWWAGGPFAALTAAPIVRRIWRRDLANLKRLVESSKG